MVKYGLFSLVVQNRSLLLFSPQASFSSSKNRHLAQIYSINISHGYYNYYEGALNLVEITQEEIRKSEEKAEDRVLETLALKSLRRRKCRKDKFLKFKKPRQ